MILLTVGTWQFDELIRKVDELAGGGVLADDVVGQIGCGSYVPKHFREFHRLIPDLPSYIRQADVVISHGGMTTFEVLRMGKRLISVCNPNVADNHQEQIVSELARLGHVIWCRDLDNLLGCIRSAQPLRPYRPSTDSLAQDIRQFILGDGDGDAR